MKKYLYFAGDEFYPANDLILVTDKEIPLEEIKRKCEQVWEFEENKKYDPFVGAGYVELVILDTETNKFESKLLYGCYFGHPDHTFD